MMPNWVCSRRAASCATNCPTRVILNAVLLITSATVPISLPLTASSACLTTPGPLTPTLTTVSGSVTPWKAPAIKGLSLTALQNTTSFAQPIASRSAVKAAVLFTTRPISATASILIPALVEPTLTEEQTISVQASASGIEAIKLRSPFVYPLSTSALKPPIKFTPTWCAALSSA